MVDEARAIWAQAMGRFQTSKTDPDEAGASVIAEALAERDARIAEQAKEIERLGSLAKVNNDLARMEVAYRKQLAFQRAETANALEAVTSQYGDRLPAQFLADLTAMLMRPALRAAALKEKNDVA